LYFNYVHNSDVIETIFETLRKLRNNLDKKTVDYIAYDQSVSMLLMILEPLIMNNQNLEISIKKKAVSELVPIIMD
jgi:hypothetical protein